MSRIPARSLKQADDPLHVYKSKRDFALTSEPAGSERSGGDPLGFVVQKHWASTLHGMMQAMAGRNRDFTRWA